MWAATTLIRYVHESVLLPLSLWQSSTDRVVRCFLISKPTYRGRFFHSLVAQLSVPVYVGDKERFQ